VGRSSADRKIAKVFVSLRRRDSKIFRISIGAALKQRQKIIPKKNGWHFASRFF
jgi:hypothetical protein